MARYKDKKLAKSNEAVLYARVSSKEQEKEGFSIPAQQKLLKEYAGKQGFRVVSEFVDVETAKATGRTQFGKMLGFLKSNSNVRIILVEKTDRLYRNFRDYVLLEELNAEIHLVKENEIISENSRSHAKFIHGIKVLMAKNYIDNLSEEVKKGLQEKADQGGWPHLAPLGYLNHPETHQLIIDPDRGPLVVELFETYANGSQSFTSLREIARKMGLKYRRTGRIISRGCIEKMLKNPIYTGSFLWKGRMYIGNHTPLVTEELFERVQLLLGNVSKPKSITREFAFKGLLKCGYCGCSITAEIQKNRYIYYRCTNGKAKCQQSYIREEKLAELLGDLIRRIQIDASVAEKIRNALKEGFDQEKDFRKSEIEKLQRTYDKIQERLDQCYLDKLDGTINADFWQSMNDKLSAEQNEITGKIRRLEQSNRNYFQEGVKFLELAQQAYSQYLIQNPAEQAKLLKGLLSNCTIKGTTLYPTYKKPFNFIAEGDISQQWRRR